MEQMKLYLVLIELSEKIKKGHDPQDFATKLIVSKRPEALFITIIGARCR